MLVASWAGLLTSLSLCVLPSRSGGMSPAAEDSNGESVS